MVRRIKALGLFAAGGLTTYGVLETLKTSEWSGSKWSTANAGLTSLFKSNSSNSNNNLEVELPQTPQKTSNLGAISFSSSPSSLVLHKSTRPAVSSELKNGAFTEAAAAAAGKLNQWRAANQIPGFVVGVSVRGETVWRHADGYADIENGVPCTADTVMRIASISKAITSALLGKLMAEKKIDIDLPIRSYLTAEQWPDKSWEGEKVEITLRQLASHLGGIRHYKWPTTSSASTGNAHDGDFPESEFYLYKRFPGVLDSLALFKDDPLVAKPGTKYNYTTFGFTLISAKGPTFQGELKRLFATLGMRSTFLDENQPLVYNRASYYIGRAGGCCRRSGDLLTFGNAMLYSFKGADRAGRPGFLPQAVVDQLWTPAEATKEEKGGFFGYGLGWVVVRNESARAAFTAEPRFSTIISHSGGAVGASSLLLIEPDREIVLSLLVNVQAAGELYRIGYDVLEAFQRQAIALEGGGGDHQHRLSTPGPRSWSCLGGSE
ncbi:hypothetical protein TYRP_018198 [Tyrophagus putrescentiae]|nr:hypothetical protein TYRP_018198 [Tyrophagus putrescentiae]